jgi:hypothetical protein
MITGQLVINETEAYVASCTDLQKPGPHGESSAATIWHTRDRGTTWTPLRWRRQLRVFVSRGLLAPWPPEAIRTLQLRERCLEIEFWEDGGTSGMDGANTQTGYRTEPIWRATLDHQRWSLRFDRRWKVSDGLYTQVPIELDLPGFATPPSDGPYR